MMMGFKVSCHAIVSIQYFFFRIDKLLAASAVCNSCKPLLASCWWLAFQGVQPMSAHQCLSCKPVAVAGTLEVLIS